MRIISGSHKGRKIKPPRNLDVRPTTDRSKEGLFNILQNRYDLFGTRVLDLYAGTGSISYEFASRGSTLVTAVDKNQKCTSFIQETADKLTLKISVIPKESLKFLEKSCNTYHFIFADPPYDFELEIYKRIVNFSKSNIKKNGLLIIEHSNNIDLIHLDRFLFK